MPKNKPASSINDYPEHLNPFYEGDHHNRLRFWDRGKNFIRRSSFSFSDIKTLPRRLSFRSKTKTDSEENPRKKYQSNSTVLQRKVYPADNSNYATIDVNLRKTTPSPGTALNDIPSRVIESPSRPSTSLGLTATESQTQTLLRKKRRAPPPPTVKPAVSEHSIHSQECHSNNPFDDDEGKETKNTEEISDKPTPPPRTKLKEDEQKNDLVQGRFGFKNEIILNVNGKHDQVDKTEEVKKDENPESGIIKDLNGDEENEKDAKEESLSDDKEKSISVDKDLDLSNNKDKNGNEEKVENGNEKDENVDENKSDLVQKKIVKIDINLSNEETNGDNQTENDQNIIDKKDECEYKSVTDVDENNTNVEKNKNILENSKMEIIKYIDIITERIDKNECDDKKDFNQLNDNKENINQKDETESLNVTNEQSDNHKINSDHSISETNKTDINFNTETDHLENINHEDVVNDPDKLLAMVQKLQLEVEKMTFDFSDTEEFATNSQQNHK